MAGVDGGGARVCGLGLRTLQLHRNRLRATLSPGLSPATFPTSLAFPGVLPLTRPVNAC